MKGWNLFERDRAKGAAGEKKWTITFPFSFTVNHVTQDKDLMSPQIDLEAH